MTPSHVISPAITSQRESSLLASVPTGLLINGKWVAASDGGTFDVHDPATGEVLATLASATSEDAVEPSNFKTFGSVSSGIQEYVKVIKTSGVTTRYVMWEFEAGSSATAFMQLVAAGPEFQESPSAGYIALVVIIVLSLLAVGGFMYVFLKGKRKRRRFYKATGYGDLAKENAEFSTDSSASDSDDSSSDSSDSDSDSESADSSV